MKPVQKKPDPKIRPQRLVARSNPQHDETLTHSPVSGKRKYRFSQISFLAGATLLQFGALVLSDIGSDMVQGAALMAHWREAMLRQGGI